MPIVFIHGVNTRDHSAFETARPLLQRYIAPCISTDPSGVSITHAYWGDVAAKLAWEGASRPRTPILQLGSREEADLLRRALLSALHASDFRGLPASPGPANSGVVGGSSAARPAPVLRLSSLTPKQLSDLLASVLTEAITNPAELAQKLLAADELAHDSALYAALRALPDAQAELRYVIGAINRSGGALAQGVFDDLYNRAKETLERAADLPGWMLTRLAAEFRKPLQEFVSRFLGDLLTYLEQRGRVPDPGPIPLRLLEALKAANQVSRARNNEPVVLMSHSMGGQVAYDVLTHFIPHTPGYQDLRVDFWCATASQVGFFEELKLFRSSDPAIGTGAKVPLPPNLGHLWSVWDHNDFLSFTAKDIFEGIEDEHYDGGLWLAPAHSAYLFRPSFYRRFAEVVETAKANHWSHP